MKERRQLEFPTLIAIAGATVVAAWLIVAPVVAARGGDELAFTVAACITGGAALLVLLAWLFDRRPAIPSSATTAPARGGRPTAASSASVGSYMNTWQSEPTWRPEIIVLHEHHHHTAPPLDDDSHRAPAFEHHHTPTSWGTDETSCAGGTSDDYSGMDCGSDSWSE